MEAQIINFAEMPVWHEAQLRSSPAFGDKRLRIELTRRTSFWQSSTRPIVLPKARKRKMDVPSSKQTCRSCMHSVYCGHNEKHDCFFFTHQTTGASNCTTKQSSHYTTFIVSRSLCCSHDTTLSCNRESWSHNRRSHTHTHTPSDKDSLTRWLSGVQTMFLSRKHNVRSDTDIWCENHVQNRSVGIGVVCATERGGGE